MPLLRSEVRYDPLLYKDHVSVLRKKYRHMENPPWDQAHVFVLCFGVCITHFSSGVQHSLFGRLFPKCLTLFMYCFVYVCIWLTNQNRLQCVPALDTALKLSKKDCSGHPFVWSFNAWFLDKDCALTVMQHNSAVVICHIFRSGYALTSCCRLGILRFLCECF